MKRMILTLAFLIGCDPDPMHTPDEALTICHKVCGERAIDDFNYKGDRELWVDCRCGKLEIKCDGGSCGTIER